MRALPLLAMVGAACLTACASAPISLPSSLPSAAPSPSSSVVVVAGDGSGDFRTIQEALDTVKAGNASTVTILVRNGTYREKLYVRQSHVALVGEDRDRTQIVFAELRRNWRASHDTDWGAAVVNIGDDVTDFFLGNLTVHNDFGSLHGDHDHQFAIRSGGNATRISLVHANVIADGGDTLSLWNTGTGMTYHADCRFEGWIDFVCPRGWCYITGSRFFSHSPAAAIWHDGSKDPDQKLVIRRSSFDGVPDFPLGRNNRDGQFFLLDSRFSSCMADRPIYRPSPAESYQWPPRVYFDGCHREGGDFDWFADNLGQAEGAPRPRDITARWTFGGRWDPEGEMPAVLPYASIPRPEDGDSDVPVPSATLRWAPARGALKYRVSFGTSGLASSSPSLLSPQPFTPPPFRAEVTSNSFDPGPLAEGTTYHWRVDVVSGAGVVEGPVWSFRTAERPACAALRIALAGDSTVTDEIGWGRGFQERLGPSVSCLNFARNGRSSKSFRAEWLWPALLASRPYVVLIQFGHNDMPGKGPDRETDPNTAFRENLSRYVDEARAAGALPVLVTSLARRYFEPDGSVRSDLQPWVATAREVARDKEVPLIDLHARSLQILQRLGLEESYELGIAKSDGSPDRTHLSRKGGTLFGAVVADELRGLFPSLIPPSAPGWAECLDQPDRWYAGPEAVQTARNVLFYQRSSGGWPKNIDMARPLDPSERAVTSAQKERSDATIDNDATTAQIRFLARVAESTATGQMPFRAAVLAGLDYLLRAQYPNGGWPQFFPLRSDYSRFITFNDDAMVGVMTLLRDVGEGKPPFAFVDAEVRTRARDAIRRGLDVILRAQLRPGGRRAAWCAQVDAVTLEPRGARSYEHPSSSGRESVEIVRYLMKIERPSPEVVEAIEGATAWFRRVAISGIRVTTKPDPASPYGRDVVVVTDPSAPAVWARFYELGTDRPIFSGRDGVVRYDLSEIEAERRTHYSWLGRYAANLLESEYPAWKGRLVSH